MRRKQKRNDGGGEDRAPQRKDRHPQSSYKRTTSPGGSCNTPDPEWAATVFIYLTTVNNFQIRLERSG